jgi:hypothetical protein
MLRRRLLLVCAAGAAFLAPPAAALSPLGLKGVLQEQTSAPQRESVESNKAVKKVWQVRRNAHALGLLDIKAKNAPLGEIAAEIGRLLKVPVTISPLLAKSRVTLDLVGLPLETTLGMLAPQAYVDYIITDSAPTPKCAAIYLSAWNEEGPPPPKIVAVAVYVEGNTEDIGSTLSDPATSLRVSFDRGKLSVFARKQPLSVVLYEIAQKIGVEVDLENTSVELIDVDFSEYSVENAVLKISPAIQLFVRTNLRTLETKPLRLVLRESVKN